MNVLSAATMAIRVVQTDNNPWCTAYSSTLSITVKGLWQRILKVLTQGMYKTNIAWQERELFKSFSKVVSLEDFFVRVKNLNLSGIGNQEVF